MKRVLGVLAVALVAGALPVAASATHRPGHQPKSLTIVAQPNPVVFGRFTVVSGRLRGPDNGGKTVTLLADAFPFDGFQPVATAVTNAQGDYAFAVRPLVNTRYQTRQGGTFSPIITVLVRIRTSLFVSDARPDRGQRVRFSGRACPEHDGALVRIQRLTTRGYVTIRRTRLRDARRCSVYRRILRVFRRGVFRAVVSGHADHASGISGRRRIEPH